MLESFRAAHPEHELQGEVTRKLAAAYLESGRSVEAARELDAIARDPATPEDLRRDAALQAASLYEKADDAAAPSPCTDTSSRPSRRRSIPPSTRASASRSCTGSAARRRQRSELHGDRRGGRRRRRGAHASAAARPQRRRRSRSPTRSSRPFRRMRLVTPLKQSLAHKKAGMERLLDAYGRAAGYGITDVTTAATYRIAELYAGARDARSRRRSVPRSSSADELEQYEMLLEEQAFPFEEKAVEVHEANARRAADGVYDDWVQASFTRLAELVPGRYAKSERSEAFVVALE